MFNIHLVSQYIGTWPQFEMAFFTNFVYFDSNLMFVSPFEGFIWDFSNIVIWMWYDCNEWSAALIGLFSDTYFVLAYWIRNVTWAKVYKTGLAHVINVGIACCMLYWHNMKEKEIWKWREYISFPGFKILFLTRVYIRVWVKGECFVQDTCTGGW